ncbi:MAG TPA: YadA-like family protein [Rhodanobacteraceae bacterium]|nr:YadA-like family protein [Rhodanobacteraceae bacterium]
MRTFKLAAAVAATLVASSLVSPAVFAQSAGVTGTPVSGASGFFTICAVPRPGQPAGGPVPADAQNVTAEGVDMDPDANTCAPTMQVTPTGESMAAGAIGTASMAAGTDAIASGDSTIALGQSAQASGTATIAVGVNAVASGVFATALGQSSLAQGGYSTALGLVAQSIGQQSTAAGAYAGALGADSSAFGYLADAYNDNATALGSGASAFSSGTAVGTQATAYGDSSTAVGANAFAPGANSVALGSGSVADRANAVSVGADGPGGFTRQITDVAAGTQPTDATNVAQVEAGDASTLNAADRYTDASGAKVLNWANAYTDLRVGQLTQTVRRVLASGAAMTQMVASFSGADPNDANRLAVGTGFAQGQNALAVGYQHVFTGTRNRFTVNFGGSVSGGTSAVGVGAGMSW